MSGQHFTEMSCYLHMNHNLSFEIDKPYLRHILQRPIPVYSKCIQSTRPSIRLCQISAGTKHAHSLSVVETVNRMKNINDSIYILNEGVWWRNTKMSKKIEINKLKELKNIRKGNNFFIWRETLAQHFPTTDGRYGSWYSNAKTCSKIQISPPNHRNIIKKIKHVHTAHLGRKRSSI